MYLTRRNSSEKTRNSAKKGGNRETWPIQMSLLPDIGEGTTRLNKVKRKRETQRECGGAKLRDGRKIGVGIPSTELHLFVGERMETKFHKFGKGGTRVKPS